MLSLLQSRAFYLGWTLLVLVGGGILMSFHAPFQAPGDQILTLAGDPAPGHWRVLHFLSPSCACSQRVLAHLAQRGLLRNASEEILLVQGPEPADPDDASNQQRVLRAGFPLHRINSETIPPAVGLVGVPLLLVVAPNGTIAYRGGYGPHGDQDTLILSRLQAGESQSNLPLLGCAISQHLRARVDPFHLKYRQP